MQVLFFYARVFFGQRVFYFVANVGEPPHTCASGGMLASEGPKEEERMMFSCARVVLVEAKK